MVMMMRWKRMMIEGAMMTKRKKRRRQVQVTQTAVGEAPDSS
jgi:hypothetical protein